MRVLFLTTIFALCSCSAAGRDEAFSAELEVKRGALQERLLLSGTVVALTPDKLIVPRANSWQLQVHWMVKPGARVKKGDKVVEFDRSKQLASVLEAELAVLRAINDLERQRATNQVNLGTKELANERARIALEKARIDAKIPEDTVARRTYQEYQLALTKAKSAYETSLDDLKVSQESAARHLRIKQITLDKKKRFYEDSVAGLESLTLVAPMDGIASVADHPWEGRRFETGDTVRPGWTIVEFPNLDALSVRAALSDVDDGRLREGAKVSCYLDAYPDQELSGVVNSVSPVAQQASGRSLRREFGVQIDLDTSDMEHLRPGMSVKIVALGKNLDDAVLVPRAAIDYQKAGPQVTTAQGKAQPISIEVCDAHVCAIEGDALEGTLLQKSRRVR